jgi:hypothetical protein
MRKFMDLIGQFVCLEDEWDKKVDRQWAWVMVEVDLSGRSSGEVEVVYGEWVFM